MKVCLPGLAAAAGFAAAGAGLAGVAGLAAAGAAKVNDVVYRDQG